MKICSDCKEKAKDRHWSRCKTCRTRSGRLHNVHPVTGVVVCLCGCGRPAQTMYLHRGCYSREYHRLLRGREASLLNTCPVRYQMDIPRTTGVEPPTPYTGPELADVVPDQYFYYELTKALRDVTNLRSLERE